MILRRFISSVSLTLGFAALYLATFQARMFSPDELRRYSLTLELARRGPSAIVNSGGLSRYPPLLSLIAAVPVHFGWLLDGQQDGHWSKRFGVGVPLLACILLVPLFVYIAEVLGLTRRQALLAGLIFGLTNPLWPYSKRFYSESLTALLALGAFAGILAFARRGRKWPLMAGLLCLVLLPSNNFVVPVGVCTGAFLFAVLERRWKLAGLIVLASAAGGALLAWLLYLRNGQLKSAGYETESFNYHLADAIPGLLFGPGRSIFLFAPMTFLALFGWRALWRKERSLAVGTAVAFVTVFGITCCWWAWYGGVCWGPRLLLPVIPLFSLGAVPLFATPMRMTRYVAIGITLWGVYVQVLGSSFPQDYEIYYWMKPDYSNERLAWFDWRHSTLLRLPKHYWQHPWDISSEFIILDRPKVSTIAIDHRPVREVKIVHRGEGQLHKWTITDLYAITDDGSGERRVPAGFLGARLDSFNRADGRGALDGNPRTHWDTNADRRDGMWVHLDFGSVRTDVIRLELEHGAAALDDYPEKLDASIRADSDAWTPVASVAATPRVSWNPLIFVLFGAGIVLLIVAMSMRPKEEKFFGGEGAAATPT